MTWGRHKNILTFNRVVKSSNILHIYMRCEYTLTVFLDHVASFPHLLFFFHIYKYMKSIEDKTSLMLRLIY